jgi:hypothetical protein
MEIIADMNSDCKLVKVSQTELAQLHGYNNSYSAGWDKSTMKVGVTIDIVKFSRISKYVKELNTVALADIAKRLEQASANVQEAIALASEIDCFDKLKGSE